MPKPRCRLNNVEQSTFSKVTHCVTCLKVSFDTCIDFQFYVMYLKIAELQYIGHRTELFTSFFQGQPLEKHTRILFWSTMARCGLIEKDGRLEVPLEKIRVRGTIKGFTSEVVATLEYKNIKDSPIEAIYVFPLDVEAAVCGFKATIDGRVIVAEVQEKTTSTRYVRRCHQQRPKCLPARRERRELRHLLQINVGNLPPQHCLLLSRLRS